MTSYISPAKVNLIFRVKGKRTDNYHEVASLYAAVGIYDRIEIVESESDVFWCSDSSIPIDSSNRVVKALHLFRAKTEIFKPVTIELTKAIPVRSGLGGGSSNAATTLFALNALFDNPLKNEELQELSSRIGSDEAFFFTSGFAFGEGRGEILQDIENRLSSQFVIAMPNDISLGTREVYDECVPNESSSIDPSQLIESYLGDYTFAVNDLQPAAFRVEPRMKGIYSQLLKIGFDHVVLTGSGSAFVCYGMVDSPKLAGVTLYNVSMLKRERELWYEAPAKVLT